MSKTEKRNLGRGLSALLADVNLDADATPSKRADNTTVSVHHLHPNPDQPRRDYPEAALAELAASIKVKGILQPLLVRPDASQPGHFQIVAGERRWRAAQRAQLHQLPVLIRDLNDSEVLELAIVENIQRADLNAIEEAMGYRQLMDRFGHTQEQLATALGKSRSHIANLLRILNLPPQVLAMVREGRLSAGHARALVAADDPVALAKMIVAQGMSVRQAEQLAKTKVDKKPKKQRATPMKDADTRALEADLIAHLRLKVTIDHKPETTSGEVRIRYKTLEELDGLCQLLSQ